MTIRILLLAILGYTGALQDGLKQCCRSGQVTAEDLRQKGHSHCNEANKNLTSAGRLCQHVYQLCCLKAESEYICSRGSEDALRSNFRECNFSPESNTRHGAVYLGCCMCCQLGMIAANTNGSCNMNYTLSKRCSEQQMKCCLATREAKNGPQTCESLQCSHTCKMMQGGPRCSCRRGFRLQNDSTTCKDIDECQEPQRRCLTGYTCQNVFGSFRCRRPVKQLQCRPGYVQYDTYCRDEDECASGKANCPEGTRCENTLGSFKCSRQQKDLTKCPKGYYTNNGRCIDVNECISQRPCKPSEKCVNTFGSFACKENEVKCPKGYREGKRRLSCRDVDECKENLHGCKREGEACINLPGTYSCTCRLGFVRRGYRCTDLNECELYGKRLCSHHCLNLPGAFKCSCQQGFKLAANNRTCLDINECQESVCPKDHTCFNVPGTYKCIPVQCPDYYISTSPRTCDLKCPFGVDCSRLPALTKWHAVLRRGPLSKFKFRFVYRVKNSSGGTHGKKIRFTKEKGDENDIFGFRSRESSLLIYNKKPIESSHQCMVTFYAKSPDNEAILVEYSLYLFVYVV